MKRVSNVRKDIFDYKAMDLFHADQDTGTSVPAHGNLQTRVSWYNEVVGTFARHNTPNFIKPHSIINADKRPEYQGLAPFEIQSFDITEVSMIHAIHHLLSLEYPILIIWSNHVIRDNSPNLFTMMETDQSPRGSGSGEDLEGYINRFEFNISPFAGIPMSGITIKGRVLNYIFQKDDFLPSGNYTLALCMGNIPTPKALLKLGMVLIGSYYKGEIMNSRNTYRLNDPNPIGINSTLMASSLLNMIEKVKASK